MDGEDNLPADTPHIQGRLPMPAGVGEQLRHWWEALPPPAIRWSTDYGNLVLYLLRGGSNLYGPTQIADALGVHRDTISKLARRRPLPPQRRKRWPSATAIRPLQEAWDAYGGGRVHVSSIEYELIHDALRPLLADYDMDVIAAAMRRDVRPTRIERYARLPLMWETRLLAEIEAAYALAIRNHTDPAAHPRFHSVMTKAREEGISLDKVRRALASRDRGVVDRYLRVQNREAQP